MREYLELGSTPSDENCAQIGDSDYLAKVSEECKKYIFLLEKCFPDLPEEVCFRRKSFPHDFGDYFEVVVCYNSNSDKQESAAYFVENNLPETWVDDKVRTFSYNEEIELDDSIELEDLC